MTVQKTIAWLVPSLAVTAALWVAAGCDQGDFVQTCAGTPIPANGCPTDEDDQECSDVCNCAAAYDCTGGQWTLAFTCSSFDPDAATCPRQEAPDAGSPGLGDASLCFDLNLPDGASPNQGPGCVDLQDTDCAVGQVACTSTPCEELGCGSLFYCLNGEWIPWGECIDGGVIETY